jgi:uncharacterized protein YkwD
MFKSHSSPVRVISKISLFIVLIMTGASRSVFSEALKPSGFQGKNTIVSQNEQELALVERVHQQVNEYRKSLNLPPLVLNTEISQEAKQHSKNMAQNKVQFSHKGFERRIKALNNISYRSAAENVGYNQGYQDPAKQAVEGWINSEGHRQNLTGNYNLTGIGIAKNQQEEYYFTQIFILEN